jgi:hypothetical protein
VERNKNNRMKTKVLICSFIFASIPNSVIASVGFYPIEKGEVLRAEACVPKNTKPPISLQINSGNGKPVSVATINSIPKSSGECGKNERQVFINWKVDRTGIYGLSFRSTKSKITFTGWPDGIEVKGS